MCGLCGALGKSPAWEQERRDAGGDYWRVHQEAIVIAAELTSLLSASRVRITARRGFGFVVGLPTGRTALVPDLFRIWHSLDEQKIAIPDPLSERFASEPSMEPRRR